MVRGKSPRCVVTLLAAAAALFATAPADAADPVIAAAGDIACSSTTPTGSGSTARCHQRATSDILMSSGLSAVLTLGDAQYQNATLSSFNKSYNPTWGRVKPITFPSAGNHEYKTAGAKGYFDYFNGANLSTGRAGDRTKGYYSFDVGTWHLVALNTTDKCTLVPCGKGSAQEQWLRADLAAHPASCTLAFWHHPRFNSGHEGNATFMQAIFQDLYDADADVLLGGHAHDYERFAPQNPAGKLDKARGIRQFVVGTGGAFFTALSTTKPNSEVRNASTYGVLLLTLHPSSYDWRFVAESGKRFTDSGSQACHGLVAPRPGVPNPGPPSGAPKIRAHGQPAASCTIVGTPGDDVLVGTPYADVICGLAGNDRINGLAGDDLVGGGAGNDTVRGGNDQDELLGGRGRDALFGGRGNDTLHGNFASDLLRGQSGNDRITGEGGRNRMYGDAGNDVLIAWRNRRGGDRVYGGKGHDRAVINHGDRVRSAKQKLRRRGRR